MAPLCLGTLSSVVPIKGSSIVEKSIKYGKPHRASLPPRRTPEDVSFPCGQFVFVQKTFAALWRSKNICNSEALKDEAPWCYSHMKPPFNDSHTWISCPWREKAWKQMKVANRSPSWRRPNKMKWLQKWKDDPFQLPMWLQAFLLLDCVYLCTQVPKIIRMHI